MNRLDKLKKRNSPILTCYLPGGDPFLVKNQSEIYASCGVDVFEIGIPTLNPFMDGVLVSNSMSRAIKSGVTTKNIANEGRMIREAYEDTAVVMMGYQDVLITDLIDEQGTAGFDGFIQVGVDSYDQEMLSFLDVYGIEFIPQKNFEESLERARKGLGYIFLQAASGKTGLSQSFDMDNKERIRRLKEYGVDIPILLGFGISNADQVRMAMDCGADGVVIGSACIAKALEGEKALTDFLKNVRGALDGK